MAMSVAEQRLSELERDLAALLANERALVTSPTPAGLCEQILRQAIAATGADAGSVFLRDLKSSRMICVAAAGEKAAAVRNYSLVPGRGIVGAVAETGKPILTEASDPRHDRSIASRIDYPVGGILCVPITDDSRTVGVIEVLTREKSPKKFDVADVSLLELMAGQAARAIEAVRLLDQRMRAERLEALALVIRGVVHDVRNPLTFINGYAEMLADEADPKFRTKSRDAIFRNVEDINEMLHELADFAAGDDTVHEKSANLGELAADLVRLFQPRAENAKVKLTLRVRGVVDAFVDVGKVRRAISNLLKNAIEATPHGGRIHVVVCRRKTEMRPPVGGRQMDDLFVWVRDTGRGVPAEVMGRLFEPFVTQGKKGGTGLGLSICRRFAEQHGGEVGCRTGEGRGTRFVIRIPAR